MPNRKTKAESRFEQILNTADHDQVIAFAREHGFLTRKLVLIPPKPRTFERFDPGKLGILYAKLQELGEHRYRHELGNIRRKYLHIAVAERTETELIALAKWITSNGDPGKQFKSGLDAEEEKLTSSECCPSESSLGVLRVLSIMTSLRNLAGDVRVAPQA